MSIRGSPFFEPEIDHVWATASACSGPLMWKKFAPGKELSCRLLFLIATETAPAGLRMHA